MKYSPLNNQPNVSRTRSESILPSLKLDSRPFPHITWLEQQLGRFSYNYSYWDGLKWSCKDFPEVCISKEEIIASPNSIVLDENEEPIVTFARKIGSGNRLTLASYNNGWDFNNLDVDYDLNWIGVTKQRRGIEYSSSSSSSSSYIKNWSSSSISSSSISSSSISSSSSSSSSPSSSSISSSSSSSISSSSSSSISSSSSSSPSSSSFSSNSSSSISSPSSSIDSSSSSSVDSHSSSSSSDNKKIWVTAKHSPLFGTADFYFYDNNFNYIYTIGPLTYGYDQADFKDDGYWIVVVSVLSAPWYQIDFKKYSYSGNLLTTQTCSYFDWEYPIPLYVGGIAIDEVNHYYYVILRNKLLRYDIDPISHIWSYIQTTGMVGYGLFLNKSRTDIYVIGDSGPNNIEKLTSSLVHVAYRSGTESFSDGYLDGNYWHMTIASGLDQYDIYRYSKDGNDLPTGIPVQVGTFANSSGGIGKIEGLPEESSSSTLSSESLSSNSSSSSSSSSSLSSSSSSSISSSSVSSPSSSSSSSYIKGWSSSSLSSSFSSSSSSYGYSESSSSSSIDSHSSSSSSSYNDSPYFVTVYDTTNAEFKIYSVGSIWRLIGSKSAAPDSCIKIDACEKHIGIGFIDEDLNIQVNFFDVDGEAWSFFIFEKLVASQTYDNIIDMDLAGYNIEDDGILSVGWLSKKDEYFYVCSEMADSNGVETPTDNINVVVERNATDVITDYIVNGYRRIGVYKDGDYTGLFVMGASNKSFVNYKNDIWISNLVEIGGPSNGIVCNEIRNQNGCIVFSSDSGDIYYYEIDLSDEGFNVSAPDMILLNDEWSRHVNFMSGQMDGQNITGSYETYCGDILGDNIKRVMVISNKVLVPPVTTTTTTLVPTTTTTTTTSAICCSNMGPSIILTSGCTLSNWNINWMGHSNINCTLNVNIGYPTVPGIGFILYDGISIRAHGVVYTNLPQTITLVPLGAYSIGGTVFWNGIQRTAGDGIGPWIIHC